MRDDPPPGREETGEVADGRPADKRRRGRRGRLKELVVLLLVALLPIAAHAPAWRNGILIAPGDGTALHFPLRAAVWHAYARGEMPGWNGAQFCGTPLLAAYRPGAFYPPMVVLSPLPPYLAFQLLVLFSLSACAVLTFLYLRRLRAGLVGAYIGALSFALGPYLVGHLDDTASVIASPLLPLLLLAAESHMNRASLGRAAGLAAAIALLLLAGSPEAARAGVVLLLGRVVVGYVWPGGPRPPSWPWSFGAVAGGLLLSAPQLLPALIAAAEAGRPLTGIATDHDALPGAMGLILRYISHTPAAALAMAALPLLLTHASVRVLTLALVSSLALQWGSSLNAHAMGPLVFDFSLAVLAGLSLDAIWTLRGTRRGRRLRAYFISFALASAAALSVAAATLGPLPASLTGAVGVFALSFILFFSLAGSPSVVRAGLWLLPLTVSFLLQPHGRAAWRDAATRDQIENGTPTRAAIDRLMGLLYEERVLTLARAWPRGATLDLGYGGLAAASGRRSANGYDPMVPLRSRRALGGMNAGGLLPEEFFRSDQARLDALGVRWVQVPTSDLASSIDLRGRLELSIPAGQARLFPLPILAATEIHLLSSLSEAVSLRQGSEVAQLVVRLASGRGEFSFPIRAGIETAEWAYDRPDVRARIRHQRAPVGDTWRPREAAFDGHRYLAVLRLPGRYHVDAVRLTAAAGAPPLLAARILVADPAHGTKHAVTATSAFVSDTAAFRETAATPALRFFERPRASRAWMAAGLRVLDDDRQVLAALGALTRDRIDPRHELLVTAGDARGVVEPPAGSGRAEIVRADAEKIDLRAEGPGWLVLAESWHAGWRASVDGAPSPILRVNHAAMAVALPPGNHRVAFRYRTPGLAAGLACAGLAMLGLATAFARSKI